MTRADVNTDISTKITSKTAAGSLTNTDDGANRVLMLDYVDQQVITKSVKLTLTAMQVQSLFTTPIKIIEGVAGKSIYPLQMVSLVNNLVVGYSPSGGQLALRHESSSTNLIVSNTTLGSFGDGEGYGLSSSSITRGGFSSDGEDIFVRLTSADPVGGDGGMVIYVNYFETTL